MSWVRFFGSSELAYVCLFGFGFGPLGWIYWNGHVGWLWLAEFGGIGLLDLSDLVRLVKFDVLGFLSWVCFAGLDYVSKFWFQIFSGSICWVKFTGSGLLG